jgi:cyclohexanecarboxyl-CoA dehydrogenase
VQMVGTKLAFEVVQNCLLINGHGAYTTEMPYEQRLRDVLGLQIGDGTAQIMKLVIARHKAGRKGVRTVLPSSVSLTAKTCSI